jgi:moderate conductance mechanosensitive channel
MDKTFEKMLAHFGVTEVPPWVEFLISIWHVFLILLLAWIVLRVKKRLLGTFRSRLLARSENPEESKRVETLSRVFSYVASVLISVITLMLVLSELGISIAPILATAGVAGIAVDFGAQTLVKDYFTGFVMLIENQVRQGDVVEVAGKSGLVEEVTLRYIKLRDYEGSVHYVPNSAIDTVTNRSREFAFSVINVGVAYKEDVDRVFEVMRTVAADLRADETIGPRILEDLDIAGVDQWADSAVILRCRFKVRALEQWGVRREYLRRLKKAFDANGIEIPFPHLTIYAGQDEKAMPMPLKVVGGDIGRAG